MGDACRAVLGDRLARGSTQCDAGDNRERGLSARRAALPEELTLRAGRGGCGSKAAQARPGRQPSLRGGTPGGGARPLAARGEGRCQGSALALRGTAGPLPCGIRAAAARRRRPGGQAVRPGPLGGTARPRNGRPPSRHPAGSSGCWLPLVPARPGVPRCRGGGSGSWRAGVTQILTVQQISFGTNGLGRLEQF